MVKLNHNISQIGEIKLIKNMFENIIRYLRVHNIMLENIIYYLRVFSKITN